LHRLPRIALPAGALPVAAILAATGCGGGAATVDAGTAEAVIKQGIEAHSKTTVTKVVCPDGVEIHAGATFQCGVATTTKASYLVTLLIRNDRGALKVIDLKPGRLVPPS
jgi:hypothetical protein